MSPDLAILQRQAKSLGRYRHEHDELMSVGCEGWIRAGRTYDPAAGFPEGAHRAIRSYGAMLDFIRGEAMGRRNPGIEPGAYNIEPAIDLIRCIEALSDDDQEAIRLRVFDSVNAVATLFGVTKGQGSRRYAAIESRLRSLLEGW